MNAATKEARTSEVRARLLSDMAKTKHNFGVRVVRQQDFNDVLIQRFGTILTIHDLTDSIGKVFTTSQSRGLAVGALSSTTKN